MEPQILPHLRKKTYAIGNRFYHFPFVKKMIDEKCKETQTKKWKSNQQKIRLYYDELTVFWENTTPTNRFL